MYWQILIQIYDIDLVPLLVQTVKSLFEKYAVKEFLISATLRNERTFGAFLNACGAFVPSRFSNTGMDIIHVCVCVCVWNQLTGCACRAEESALKVERVPFESPAEEVQTGFFHSTVIPIRTYKITA